MLVRLKQPSCNCPNPSVPKLIFQPLQRVQTCRNKLHHTTILPDLTAPWEQIQDSISDFFHRFASLNLSFHYEIEVIRKLTFCGVLCLQVGIAQWEEFSTKLEKKRKATNTGYFGLYLLVLIGLGVDKKLQSMKRQTELSLLRVLFWFPQPQSPSLSFRKMRSASDFSSSKDEELIITSSAIAIGSPTPTESSLLSLASNESRLDGESLLCLGEGICTSSQERHEPRSRSPSRDF